EPSRRPGIIGAGTGRKLFNKAVMEAMARITERPIISPYSTPTPRSECTAEEAYQWSQGGAIFASGSPFPPVSFGGKTFVPGQGNNDYIFPALCIAVSATQASRETYAMLHWAASSEARHVPRGNPHSGLLYPA